MGIDAYLGGELGIDGVKGEIDHGPMAADVEDGGIVLKVDVRELFGMRELLGNGVIF